MDPSFATSVESTPDSKAKPDPTRIKTTTKATEESTHTETIQNSQVYKHRLSKVPEDETKLSAQAPDGVSCRKKVSGRKNHHHHLSNLLQDPWTNPSSVATLGHALSLNIVMKVKAHGHKKHRKPKKLPDPATEFLSKAKIDQLRQTVRQLMTPGLGILAADDSNNSLALRLKEINLEDTETNRHRYHEMLLGGEAVDKELKDCLSGVLMREESIMQLGYQGKRLARMVRDRKILLGVRFDKGVERLVTCDREYISTGLDRVSETLKKVKEKGVKFGLYRCVYRISDYTPSRVALMENSLMLTKFAVLCQQSGIVPIVAPEVLAEGTHGPEEARRVLRDVLTTLVKFLIDHHVHMAGTLIRITACSPGVCFEGQRDLITVAYDTAKTLIECLPPAIGGVLMAREEDLCTSITILNHIQNCPIKKPFFVSFCFSRVIQEGVASVWAGQNKNLDKARAELMRRAEECSLAAFGHTWDKATSIFIAYEDAY